MTRSEVARYLGKNIATVRRAEGRHLHPRRDQRGVFQFDPAEVRELRAAIDSGEVRLSRIDFAFHRNESDPLTAEDRDEDQIDDLDALRKELEELRATARDAVELFYIVCPVSFLAELDDDVLDAFDAVAAPDVRRTNARGRPIARGRHSRQ